VKTEPKHAFLFSHLSQWATRPSAKTVLTVWKVISYIKECVASLKFKPVTKENGMVLLIWVDALYEQYAYKRRLGYEVQLVSKTDLHHALKNDESNLFAWKSKKCDRKLGLTTSAELLTFCDGVKNGFGWVCFIKKLWGVAPRVCVLTDSQPHLAQLASGRCESEPKMQGMLEYVLEQLDDLHTKVKWMHTKSMRADR